MKSKLVVASALSVALMGFVPLALAKDGADDASQQTGVQTVKVEDSSHRSGSEVGSSSGMDSARDIEERGASSTKVGDDDSDDDSNDDNSLHIDGDLRDNLGPNLKWLLQNGSDIDVVKEVGDVVNGHASSSEHMSDAARHVEGRPAWLVFLFGSDFKNLGDLRSEIVTTQNRIDRLEKAKEKSGAVVGAEIEAQIQILKDTASTTDKFVRDNESKFSLLGWFFRLFND